MTYFTKSEFGDTFLPRNTEDSEVVPPFEFYRRIYGAEVRGTIRRLIAGSFTSPPLVGQ